MRLSDEDILDNLIYDFYLLFDILQVDERIPTSSKFILLSKCLKILQKEYKELIK